MTRRSTRAAATAALLAALLGLAPAGGPAAAQEAGSDEHGYVADIADLPLMPGLREVADAGVAFDKPSGRIVSAFAHGAVTADEVQRFYADTLPQLGWQPVADGRYAREGELLEIDTLGRGGDLTVRYTLQPR